MEQSRKNMLHPIDPFSQQLHEAEFMPFILGPEEDINKKMDAYEKMNQEILDDIAYAQTKLTPEQEFLEMYITEQIFLPGDLERIVQERLEEKKKEVAKNVSQLLDTIWETKL